MLPIGSHILSLISSCDDGVYVCTRLRNTAKAGLDMRNKSNFLQKIFLRNMKIIFNRCEVLENNTRLSVTFIIKQALKLTIKKGDVPV